MALDDIIWLWCETLSRLLCDTLWRLCIIFSEWLLRETLCVRLYVRLCIIFSGWLFTIFCGWLLCGTHHDSWYSALDFCARLSWFFMIFRNDSCETLCETLSWFVMIFSEWLLCVTHSSNIFWSWLCVRLSHDSSWYSVDNSCVCCSRCVPEIIERPLVTTFGMTNSTAKATPPNPPNWEIHANTHTHTHTHTHKHTHIHTHAHTHTISTSTQRLHTLSSCQRNPRQNTRFDSVRNTLL